MHIVIRTPVQGHYRRVLAQFDQSLFDQLTPPGAQVELVRFDGSHKGDLVHLRLKLLGRFPQDWISEITEEVITPEQAWFVDEGVELPFFLASWRHRHLVEKVSAEESCIVDDITFRSPYRLLDWLLYPVLYLQFAYRRPIYQRVFGKPVTA